MGRNKDSLIALAEKLTGETCGNVLTKKDALKKIACFYAGQDVECNTVADALQCIANHCEGGSGGASGGEKEIDLLITKTDDYSCTVEVNKLKMGVDFVELGLYKDINIAIMYDSSWKRPTPTENALTFNFPNTTGNEYTIAIANPNEENNIPIASFIMPDTNESVAVQINEGGGSSGGSGETITPYAEKVYTGRGYTTALIFDHTQITGECTYTDVDGGVSNINLSTRTTNLYLDSTDIVSFELEINGSKVTVNVNE